MNHMLVTQSISVMAMKVQMFVNENSVQGHELPLPILFARAQTYVKISQAEKTQQHKTRKKHLNVAQLF